MSIEELLVRDIAAVTRGIVVTDAELLEARKELNDRIHSGRMPGRLGTAVAAAAAVVVLVVAGIAAFMVLGDDDKASQPANQGPEVNDPDAEFLTGPPPTPQRIAGVWRVDNGSISLRFTESGTVSFDEKGTLFSRPVTTATYVIDGDVITITTTQDAQQNCVGTTYAMRTSIPRDGELRLVSSTTPVGACSPLGVGRSTLERVLPIGPALADLRVSTDTDWKTVTDKTVLHGLWMAEGGGHVLEMDANGTYYVVDASGGPIDRGPWLFRGTDLTLLTSVTGACRGGDLLVLGAVQYETPGTRAFRGTVKQKSACHAAWTPAAWILLPNDTTG